MQMKTHNTLIGQFAKFSDLIIKAKLSNDIIHENRTNERKSNKLL